VCCGGWQTTLPQDGERREEVDAGGVGEAGDARAMEASMSKGAHIVESGWQRERIAEERIQDGEVGVVSVDELFEGALSCALFL
jgi:hypothetical protein